MTNPNPTIVPDGFPDLFVFALLGVLRANVATGEGFLSRPARPSDPTRTITVVEGDVEPFEYEIAGRLEPSMYEWHVTIQVFVKAANEVDGRNTRRRLLQSARKALFLPSTVQALMTLSDDTDRVTSYRLRRIDFSSAEARDANKQFFFLGQIAVSFKTERH